MPSFCNSRATTVLIASSSGSAAALSEASACPSSSRRESTASRRSIKEAAATAFSCSSARRDSSSDIRATAAARAVSHAVFTSASSRASDSKLSFSSSGPFACCADMIPFSAFPAETWPLPRVESISSGYSSTMETGTEPFSSLSEAARGSSLFSGSFAIRESRS